MINALSGISSERKTAAQGNNDLFAALFDFFERDREPALLVLVAAILATVYVALSFDLGFLSGEGAFWIDPRGPWLNDPSDTLENYDVLNILSGYQGFLKVPWRLPLFLVPNLGAPTGTNIVFLDAVPIAALLGKVVSELSGFTVNPYGVFIGLSFVLSAVFATLTIAKLGQRSFIASLAATVFVLTLPALLHRFGHIPLMAHFVVIGAFYSYLVDRDPEYWWTRGLRWGAWLCLAILVNIYLTAMAGAFYGASWLRRFTAKNAIWRSLVLEAATVGVSLGIVTAAAGHFGRGAAAGGVGGSGYGFYSMNVLSPIWPQRSGLLPGFWPIIDATKGQYEGFNYLGFGALLLIISALIINRRNILGAVEANYWLVIALVALTLFAYSNVVYAGDLNILHVRVGAFLYGVLGTFRSSGRMFWPVAYVAILFSLAVVLRGLAPKWGTLFVAACCILQIGDTEPLRSRMLTLSRRDVSPPIDREAWVARIREASFLYVFPSYACNSEESKGLYLLSVEFQYAAMLADRPINSVYNPRLAPDCKEEHRSAREGPWREDALYVYLAGGNEADVLPPKLSCARFDYGTWCMGPRQNLP